MRGEELGQLGFVEVEDAGFARPLDQHLRAAGLGQVDGGHAGGIAARTARRYSADMALMQGELRGWR